MKEYLRPRIRVVEAEESLMEYISPYAHPEGGPSGGDIPIGDKPGNQEDFEAKMNQMHITFN